MSRAKGSLKYLISGFSAVNNYLIQHYQEFGLTDQELILYLNLVSYANQNNLFPNMKTLSKNLHVSESEVFNLISSLERKRILTIETRDIDGKASSYYDLDHIYQIDVEEGDLIEVDQNNSDELEQLIQKFEVEFGRPLSPIEIEKVSGWLEVDHFNADLVEVALKEAVLAQVYNFKYIDRILVTWRKRNIKTARDYENSKLNNDLL
ncbi:DnaD domain protein [Xylocopilactobacillus apicola]|uniref:DNA replication protein DnaD n=1 Tax=Xylocopilactobacillus apicola TaxID=2932184 RepID=A0AAU9DC52_9LACO|nr:DnaD domain protein [Xylocopilactobacillus apicola]BDR58382.1 DNA replication protein DnaD [Xylocopilactobacillus apicola]